MTPPTVGEIQRAVAERFGMRLIDMTSRRRSLPAAHHRQVAMYLARELTVMSLPEIGRQFGNRDHTTVLHAVRVVAGRVAADRGAAMAIAELRTRLAPSTDDPNQPRLPLDAARLVA